MLVLQLAILFDHETSFGASSTTQSSSSSTLISSLFSSSTATSSSNNLYTFAVKIYKACTPHDSQETIPSFISSSTSSSLVRLFHLYSLMYRSIQHQADISRYHRMYCHTDSFSPSSSLSSTAILSGVTPSQLEFKSWIPVLALHLKALRLTPSFGRTYSQLG